MSCTVTTLTPGIDHLFFAIVNDVPDYYVIEDKIVINDSLTFEEIDFETSNFKQTKTVDAKGITWSKTLEVGVYNFMDDLHRFENKKLVIVIVDTTGTYWITGHDVPFKLERNEGETGGDRNFLNLTFVQNSYNKVELVNEDTIQLPYPYFSYVNHSDLFDSLITGGTIAYWIRFNELLPAREKVIEKSGKFTAELNGNTFINTFYQSGSTVPNVHDISSNYITGTSEWYFVVHRLYTGFFAITCEHLVFNSAGNLVSLDQDQVLDEYLASSSWPFQLYRNSRYELKQIAVYSRPLTYNYDTVGEVMVLLNGGTGLNYSDLAIYTEPMYDRLIAYYDTIDFNSDTITDQHTNNLDLEFVEE